MRNAAVLGGDVHSFWVNDIREDFARPSSPTIATEFVTTCLASRNGPAALFDPAQALNPHVRFIDNSHAGYVLLDVGQKELTGDLRAVRDLTDPASAAYSLGRVVVADGRPGGVMA